MSVLDRAIDTPSRRHLLDLLAAVIDAPVAQVRLELLIDGLRDLVGGEVGGFNHVDDVAGRALVIMRPQVVTDPAGDLQEAYGEHPVIEHYRRSAALRPVLLSSCSFGRWRRWKDHPTYSALFRPMGTPHEIVIPVPSVTYSRKADSYAITRSGSDFGDREMGLARAAQELLGVLHASDGLLIPAGRLDLLTRTERAVAQLYGMGLTEAQIAEHRGASAHTVHTQIRTGCAKLEVSGRGRRRRLAQVFGYLPAPPPPVDRLARSLSS